jgi:hypothetical protein
MSDTYTPVLLDCTLRDCSYYNVWVFDPALNEDCLLAIKADQVDVHKILFLPFLGAKD